ncbi:MAG: FGGY-family carbohydrate kinase [Fibrobacteres bacterium]|nr:FGGY-family carbohydrate kinase [Fibrobacterota bacterium]
MESFLGIDVGSGSVRAAIFDASGNRLGISVREIKQHRPKEDFVEQSSNDIWSNLCSAVKEAVAKSGVIPAHIKGIGFDATCSLVALDKNNKSVTVSPTGDNEWNVIMWMDHRATKEALEIDATGSEVLKYVGGKVSVEMELPKLLWLKRNMTESYKKTAKYFDLADFLVYKACGNDVRSVCTKVCKWSYLAHEKRWSIPLFENVGLQDLFENDKIGNKIADLGEKAGVLTKEAASEMGLFPGIAIAVGMIDAHAGGLGVLTDKPEETLALIGGTSSCHMAVSKEPIFVPGVWGPYWGAMLPGYWLSEGGQSATGALIDHVIRNSEVFASLKAEAEEKKISIYELLNKNVEKLRLEEGEPTKNFHLLDYFHGNRSPRADASLRGTVVGQSLNRTADEAARLYLAAIQSVAYGTRHIIEEMNRAGHKIKRIHMCGGGTKNTLFLKEHADITGCEIVLSKESEAVLLGSAILAASASGVYDSIFSAMKSMNGTLNSILPDKSRKTFHDKKYSVYLEMYKDQMKYKEIMEE